MEELQREDMDVNQPDSKGRLPLIEAVRTKEVKLVDALLQYGALAKSKDPATGASPLHVAFQQNLPQVGQDGDAAPAAAPQRTKLWSPPGQLGGPCTERDRACLKLDTRQATGMGSAAWPAAARRGRPAQRVCAVHFKGCVAVRQVVSLSASPCARVAVAAPCFRTPYRTTSAP